MQRVYKYRLSPTPAQGAALVETCWRLCELYNAALQERRDAYRKTGVSVKKGDQSKQLVAVRELRPEYAALHFHLLQDVVTRLDRAYQAFFRRVKAGEKPGYPRFRAGRRYHSFTFKDAANRNGAALVAGGKRLNIHGVGKVKLRLHRPMEGKLKQVTITHGGDGHWYACMMCDEVPARPLPPTGAVVGIDVGLSSFIATSDEDTVENPHHLAKAEQRLKTAQRRVSRRKKGSVRRRKAIVLLAKQHDKVRRVRRDFHHKVALALVVAYDLVAVEKLRIRNMVKNHHLAKSIHDAGWGQFLGIVANKAESAGRVNPAVEPSGTSIDCAACDEPVPKDLSVRVHHCPYCGYTVDRDVNAAQNVLKKALGPSVRGGGSRKPVVETRSPHLALEESR